MTETMNAIFMLTPQWLAGLLLGGVFFGGLWFTVQKSLASTQPALWLMGSFVLRMGMTALGFYVLAGTQWQRWLACLLGFFLARAIVMRWTRGMSAQTTLASPAAPRSPHAP